MTATERRTEWRVQSETTEDDFGQDEQEARAWFDLCERSTSVDAPRLMHRTVTVTATDWEQA